MKAKTERKLKEKRFALVVKSFCHFQIHTTTNSEKSFIKRKDTKKKEPVIKNSSTLIKLFPKLILEMDQFELTNMIWKEVVQKI